MTSHYDVERAITTLGIGEAFVTVLSPKGVPTPLAATRLLPPDSRMAPLTPPEIASVVAASPLAARYNQAVDRESAYEIITARLANAHAAATAAAAAAAPPTPDRQPPPSIGALTPAQQQREIARQARELETARREAERERKAQERATRADERQQQKTMETAMRTVGPGGHVRGRAVPDPRRCSAPSSAPASAERRAPTRRETTTRYPGGTIGL